MTVPRAVLPALMLAIGFAGSVSSAEPFLRRLSLSGQTISQFGRLELTLDLNAAPANPHDPAEIAVLAVFRAPSGKQVFVPAFHYQDFERTQRGGREELKPRGQPVWKVRYAPTETGLYRFHIEAACEGRRYETASIEFRCVRGASRGFVRVGGNGRSFEFDDGAPFFPIGLNLCWGRNLADYERWFDKLAANGCNWARLWIGPWDLFTLEQSRRVGHYDQAGAWRLDYVTDLAERKGIRLMFCLESFNSLRISPSHAFWANYPYSAANGGPCVTPEEFFTDDDARRLFRQRLRCVVARWGYSTHVFAWELWNEVDIIEKYVSSDVTAWHVEMARYLRELDPNDHLVTTSFANSNGDPAVDGLREMSFVQTHNYGAEDLGVSLNRYSLEKTAAFRKPHFVGEFGLDAEGKLDAEDPHGAALHEGLWAGTVSLAAGSPMSWWWDNYIEPRNLYYHYKPLAAFVGDVEWNKRRWRPAQAALSFATPQPPKPIDVKVAGRHNEWRDHPSNAPVTVTVNNDGTVIGAETLGANLHGFRNHPTWHNPVSFVVDSTRPWELIVSLTAVSDYGGAKLKVRVDGQLVLGVNLKDDDPKREGTMTFYNGEYVVPVPAGKHTVTVLNDGTDWLSCSYLLRGYADKLTPDLRVFGTQDDSLALLWIQNETASHYARTKGIERRTIENVRLTVRGLRDGSYSVEWWNTLTGDVQRAEAESCDGVLMLSVPPVETDIAVKVRRR